MPKPVRKKRPFIDRKNERTTTFALVHRSQRDPLAADSDAPQLVLHPLSETVKKRKEEERAFGIFYEDEYDYLQHLKDRQVVEHDWEEADRFLLEKDTPISTKPDPDMHPKHNLPLSVFASHSEEDVGLLNKAAPRPGPRIDWDPDIIETLDDEFSNHDVVYTLKEIEKELADEENDQEVELDLLLAEAANPDFRGNSDDEDDNSSNYDSELDDDVPSLNGGPSFSDEETKSKFTSYSMSSSVIRRNEQLTLLDNKFDEFFSEYDDENLGGLDCEEIEGAQAETSDVMKQALNSFEKDVKNDRKAIEVTNEIAMRHCNLEEEEEEAEETLVVDKETEKDDKWDCESILSTYSNLYNHPKLISEPRKIQPITVSGKTGIPKNVLGKGLTAHALKLLDRETQANECSDSDEELETKTLASRVSAISIRNKHETKEEKKVRKQAVKQLKQERRLEKKANTVAFKEEKARQEHMSLNNAKNYQGIKLL